MPELPEVETTRRHLEPALRGRRVVDVEVRHPRMLRRQPRAADFEARLQGRRVRGLRRYGKTLVLDVEGDVVWVTHLGMSGRLVLGRRGAEPPSHTHVLVHLDDDTVLWFVDPRTFGYMAAFVPEEMASTPLTSLGPDAYTELPRSDVLANTLHGRRAPIKALLMDQRIVAGLGNIYADEALHRARVRPSRPAGELDREEIKRLRAAIRVTLEEGLASGGTSLDDLGYLLPDGRAGQYASRLRVYGREGEPCPRCGSMIERHVIRGRSAFWCPACQL